MERTPERLRVQRERVNSPFGDDWTRDLESFARLIGTFRMPIMRRRHDRS
jgi:hypothetical protein